MDWDQVVTRSLDDLRNYDATVVIFFITRHLEKRSHARIQRGDRGFQTPPLKNHEAIWFLINTGPDPL